ncbi:MAG: Smr/MutS family protein [Thermomicrobiales bacterium]
MAWLAPNPNRPDELALDLHGYRYLSGAHVVRTKITEAQANGFSAIRIIHGRSTGGDDFQRPNDGTLKSAIIAVCRERPIAKLLDRDPFPGEAATTILLRPVKRPLNPPRWTALPRTEYRPTPAPPPGAAVPGTIPRFTVPAE